MKNLSIKLKLFIFSISSLIFLSTTLSFISIKEITNRLIKEKHKTLTSIRDLKKKQLEELFKLFSKEATLISNNPATKKLILQFDKSYKNFSYISYDKLPIENKKREQVFEKWKNFYKKYINADLFDDAILILKNSDFKVTLNKNNLSKTNLLKIWETVQKTGKISYIDMKKDLEYSDKPAMFLASPLYINKKINCVIILKLNVKSIQDIMKFRSGYSKTHEDYLVGSDYLMRSSAILSPKTHSIIASFKNPEVGNIKTSFVKEAFKGFSNTKIGKDYRNKKVLSSYTLFHINDDLSWALISQVDLNEVLKTPNKLKNKLIIISLFTFLIIAIILYFIIQRYIVYPLNTFQNGLLNFFKFLNEKIKDVKLLKINSEDEIGLMSKVINEGIVKTKETNDKLELNKKKLEEANANMEKQNKVLEEAKKDIEKKANELEEAGKYKSQFLANMSHELRTPLNSIILLSSLLQKNSKKNLNNDDIKKAKIIFQSGNELLKLIDDILDLSKIESGKMNIIIDKFQSKDLMAQIKELFYYTAQEKGLKLKIVDEYKGVILSDRTKVSQIINNLLSNAFKFTKKGSITLSIYPLKNTKEEVCISVVDTGIGIKKENQKLIFKSFTQANGGISRKYGGTGLGLCISQELSNLLGGVITLESKENKGSKFNIILPNLTNKNITSMKIDKNLILKAKEDCSAKNNKKAFLKQKEVKIKETFNKINLTNKNILIVDDDIKNIFVLENLLKEFKATTFVCFNGKEALNLLKNSKIHLILMDIMMPIMNGYETIKKIKENKTMKNIPIIVISAKATQQDKEKCLALGAKGYVSKPIDINTLSNLILKLINKN